MRYFLSAECALRSLETPCAYNTKTDELYELDEEAFAFLLRCSRVGGLEARGSEFADYCIGEGILKTEEVVARRPPVEKSPEPSLRYLELQITRRCNLRCRHCYIGPPEPRELSAGQINRVLEEFERMQGLRVLITGGEPLMHGSFWEINSMLEGYALRKILFTNGVLLTKKALSGLRVDEIQVSVDGLEKAHDALRGTGTFKKAMACIENAAESGLDVSVSTMVHPGNLGDFDEMHRTFTRLGLKDWTVDIPCHEGNLRENPAFGLRPDEAGKYLAYGFGDGLHGGGEGYACGLHLMSVMADGGCAKCAFYSGNPAGHIDEGLPACWSRVRPVRLDELDCDCSVVDSCRGGCRYRAELSGSPLGKDLYRCAYYGKL